MADLAQGSPLWWVARLEKQLAARRKTIDVYDRYYCGHHELKFASSTFQTKFGQMFRDASDNWMPLIVDAVQERLRVEGFRLGNSPVGDRRAWDIWQANNLDAESDVLHTEALIAGEAYTLVWADTDGNPSITVEHPSQVIVATSPEDRRIRTAAFKCWVDDDGFEMATLYLPDEIYKWRSSKKLPSSGYSERSVNRWVPRELASEPWPLPNPFGVVPVVPISNRRRMLAGSVSELANATSLQDQINKLTFDMMLASEYTAYRQRWATGMDIPTDPESGQPIEVFQHAVNRLWTSSGENTKFGEFDATDLGNYVKAIELKVQHLAAQTRTPPHYLLGQSGAFPSGESLKSTETGLIAKVYRCERAFGEGHEETIRLGLLVAGVKPRGGTARMETVWGDAESRTEAEHVDATIKKRALGVPFRQLWEDLGYSQEQMERFSEMLIEEAKLRIPAATPVTSEPSADVMDQPAA